MKTTLKIGLFFCIIFISFNSLACSRMLTYSSSNTPIPDESYIVVTHDINNRLWTVASTDGNITFMSEYAEIFTNYDDAKKAALQMSPAYIFKLYSKAIPPTIPKTTVEKVAE